MDDKFAYRRRRRVYALLDAAEAEQRWLAFQAERLLDFSGPELSGWRWTPSEKASQLLDRLAMLREAADKLAALADALQDFVEDVP